jgi:hypothetical protein
LKNLPPTGSHVLLQWVDAAESPGWNYTTEEPKLWPRKITSRGTIVGRTALGLVLSAHVSEGDGDGEKGYLSLLAIPFGCILRCEVLK